MIYVILFYVILFYVILFYVILFYVILFIFIYYYIYIYIHIYIMAARLLNEIEEYNTLELRLKESIKSNYDFLDLAELNLTTFPNIDKKFKDTITHLFINSNKITGTLDLRDFINVTTIDISDNYVRTILLNNKVTELFCKFNELEQIEGGYNLKRLNCSNNKLKRIYFKNIEILEAGTNLIEQIDITDNLKRLVIDSNPLTFIKGIGSKLTYLDISFTKINMINSFENLTNLVANSTQLVTIPKLPKLKHLELIDTKVEKIKYFELIELILITTKNIKEISSKYKINNFDINVRNKCILCISRNGMNLLN